MSIKLHGLFQPLMVLFPTTFVVIAQKRSDLQQFFTLYGDALLYPQVHPFCQIRNPFTLVVWSSLILRAMHRPCPKHCISTQL